MATYTLTINERTNAGKALLEYLFSLGVIDAKKKPSRRKGIDEAIDDFKNGRTTKCDSFDDYLEKINS